MGAWILQVLERAQDNQHRGDEVADEASFEAGERRLQVGLGAELVVGLADGVDDRLGLRGADAGGRQALDRGVGVEGGCDVRILPFRSVAAGSRQRETECAFCLTAGVFRQRRTMFGAEACSLREDLRRRRHDPRASGRTGSSAGLCGDGVSRRRLAKAFWVVKGLRAVRRHLR